MNNEDQHDLRRMIRLLADTIGLGASPTARKDALVTGLCQLVGADSLTWTLDPSESGHDPSPQAILVVRKLSESMSSRVLLRREALEPFSEREQRIARFILEEVDLFHLDPEKISSEQLRPHLTARQREALEYLLQGHRQKEIADLMGLKYDTVKGHLQALFRKFEVHSASALMRKVYLN